MAFVWSPRGDFSTSFHPSSVAFQLSPLNKRGLGVAYLGAPVKCQSEIHGVHENQNIRGINIGGRRLGEKSKRRFRAFFSSACFFFFKRERENKRKKRKERKRKRKKGRERRKRRKKGEKGEEEREKREKKREKKKKKKSETGRKPQERRQKIAQGQHDEETHRTRHRKTTPSKPAAQAEQGREQTRQIESRDDKRRQGIRTSTSPKPKRAEETTVNEA